MKRLYWLISALLIAGLIWQIPRPELSNPSVHAGHDILARHPASEGTASLLKAACYDCHSNQTVWPWYAHINPVSDFVGEHVRHGRSELNFSHWQEISEEDIAIVGKKCAKLIKDNSMPMASYLWLHPEARLTESERAVLVDYFLSLKPYDNEN